MRILVFYFLMLVSSFSYSQSNKIASLSQLHISASVLPVLQFTPEVFDYSANNFIQFSAGVNYLNGYLRVNSSYTRLNAKANVPGCRMYDNTLSYHYKIKLPFKTFLLAGGYLGLNTIRYDYSIIAPGQLIETETTAAAEIGLQKNITTLLGIFAAYRMQRIYATPRNDLSLINLGVIYHFSPNEKLAQWLE